MDIIEVERRPYVSRVLSISQNTVIGRLKIQSIISTPLHKAYDTNELREWL